MSLLLRVSLKSNIESFFLQTRERTLTIVLYVAAISIARNDIFNMHASPVELSDVLEISRLYCFFFFSEEQFLKQTIPIPLMSSFSSSEYSHRERATG